MFRSPKDHPQGVRQALLKLPPCTINMYAYVGDVGACFRYQVTPVSSCRCVFLTVMSDTETVSDIVVTLAKPDVLPEDGPLGTETCRSFIGIISILMCVNMFQNCMSKNNRHGCK